MLKFARHASAGLLGVVCAVGVATAAAPAFGQGSVGNFTVRGPGGQDARSLSAAVSYRDLDLTTAAGRAALRTRVWKTAERLCSRLGEAHLSSMTAGLSCEDDAVQSATRQEREVVARTRAQAHADTAEAPSFALTVSVAAAK